MEYIANRVLEIQKDINSENIWIDTIKHDNNIFLTQKDKDIISKFRYETSVSIIYYEKEQHPNVRFIIDGNQAGIVYSNSNKTIWDIQKEYPVYSEIPIYSLSNGWYVFTYPYPLLRFW